MNDFAVHPSQKLMLSVGKGEKCLRLWDLIKGKKAGVLQFERSVLGQASEGRFSSGEGRKVLWDDRGEVYVVGFERGAVVFGLDSVAKAVVKVQGRGTKMHQMRFVSGLGEGKRILAVSTEDGRVLFFNLSTLSDDADAAELPLCPSIAQLGGAASGIGGRIKDFEILRPAHVSAALLVVTASSDGAVRVWSTAVDEVAAESAADATSPPYVGKLLGTLETSNRITCLAAFVLDGKAIAEKNSNGAAEEAADGGEEEDVSEDEEDDDSE